MKKPGENGKGFPKGRVKRRKVKRYVGVYVQESSKRTHEGKPDLCYYYTVKRDGKLIWTKVGWKSQGINARIAFQKRMEALQASILGEPIQKDITLGELWGKYLAWAKTAKKTWKKDKERYESHLKPYFGEAISIKSITLEKIESYKQYRLSHGRKPATINRELALLKAIINKGRIWGYWKGDNPVSVAGMLPENNLDAARFLTEDEAKGILQNCSPSVKSIIAFALATGLRIGNILGLKWEMVDLEQGLIHLPKTKSGRPLTVPLGRWAREILEAQPRIGSSPLVFCKRTGEAYSYGGIRDAFRRACKKAGIDPPPRLHDLRHTWASWLVAAGIPTPLVQIMGGWTTLSMLSRYSHAAPKTLAELADRALPSFGQQ